MRSFLPITLALQILAAGPSLALSCQTSTFEEIAIIPNSQSHMMVLGEVDANFVFRGVIVGATPPDTAVEFQMENQFRGPPHLLWGGPRLAVDFRLMGPVTRNGEGMYSFIGNMCQLLVWSNPDDALIMRVRHCQRDGVCPE